MATTVVDRRTDHAESYQHHRPSAAWRRSRIEIKFGRPKDWRPVATRYDRCLTVRLLRHALAAVIIFWLGS
ncbi:hypothetical protein ASG67_05830 [Sphingomonas sp. Leaf339]|nr:hypothetical protein ASG67_05830 [Sphingomonas sp. Leaf339]